MQNSKDIIISDLIKLLMHSYLHSFYTLAMIRFNFFQSFHCNQFYFFKNNKGQVIGFINWTFLSEEQLKLVFDRNGVIPLDCWQSKGDILFFPEFIALNGSANEIINFLKSKIFMNHKALAINAKSSTRTFPKKVYRFCGAAAKKKKWSEKVESIINTFCHG